MKIAVCDDERVTLNEIEALLSEYCETRQAKLDFELFEHYSQLENRLDEFDVFLLDYKMPDVDGLEFAKELHEKYDEKKTIVFITAYPEIVYDSFEVRAFRFFVKPIKKDVFFKMVDSFIKHESSKKRITVKSEGETVNIDIDEIYYITVSRKDVFIHLKDHYVLCHKTLATLEEELSAFRFFRIHRMHLVNMNKVKSYDYKTVVMKNGKMLQMSPRRYSRFHNSFFDD